MRISLSRPFLLFLFLANVAAGTLAAESGSISGIVRDSAGKPLSGVRINLTGSQAAQPSCQTTSGSLGEYQCTSLAAGEYKLSAEIEDYALTAPFVVRITSPGIPVVADLALTRKSSLAGSTADPAHAPLQFQAAGIRGLIDPGGYSASTAGAARGMLKGIADVRRTDRSYLASVLKDWPCALEPELRKASAEAPDQAQANLRMGQFYTAHDEPSKAIPLLQRALKLDPADYVASRELAIAWLQSGEFAHARELLAPLAEDRAEPELHQLLARACEGLGNFQQAAQQYRIAESEASSEESLFGAGYELLLAGSVTDGVVAFQQGVTKYPRSIALRIGLGAAQFYKGMNAEALRSFLDASDIDPTDPRPYSFLSSLAQVAGDQSERVRSSFKRFLERRPDSAFANYYYASVLSREGNEDAKQIELLLKHAIQLDPNLAKAHLQLAEMDARRGDDQSAVPEYEAAVRLAQDDGEAHYRLAMAYKRIGKTDQSAREMQIFLLPRQRQAAGSAEIDISQFISVMDAPNQHGSQEAECPASPR